MQDAAKYVSKAEQKSFSIAGTHASHDSHLGMEDREIERLTSESDGVRWMEKWR